MIDNMLLHPSFFHTIIEFEQSDYINIYPNPSPGYVNIIARKTDGFHIIEKMELTDAKGNIVKKYGKSPTKFHIDLSDLPNGIYNLYIKTNLQSETIRVVIQH
jgi:hypothetical protein